MTLMSKGAQRSHKILSMREFSHCVLENKGLVRAFFEIELFQEVAVGHTVPACGVQQSIRSQVLERPLILTVTELAL